MSDHSNKFGLLACISLILGNMIGSGIFLLPASLAHFGSVSFFGWVISTCGALLMAFVFSTLSEAHPATGGPYAYSKAMLGNVVGFQVSICYWIAAIFSVAALMVAFTSYLSAFFPVLREHRSLAFTIELGLLWAITAMNLRGVKSVKVVQVTLTIMKICPLVLIVLVGLFHVKWEYLQTFNISGKSNLSAATLCAILTTWALMGLESATVPAEHVDNPRRNIPLATYIGTLGTAVFYIICSFVMLGIMPNETLQASTSPFVDAGNLLLGSWGGNVIGVVALISAASTAIGWVLIQGEVPLATARDGLLPRFMKGVNKNHMPHVAMIFSSIIVTIILTMTLSDAMVSNFTLLVEYSALGYLLALLFTAVAAFLTFLRDDRPAKTMLPKIILGLLATSYMIWIISSSDYQHIYYLFMILLISTPLYAVFQWWNHHFK